MPKTECRQLSQLLKEQGCDTLITSRLDTPATAYPRVKQGVAEISQTRYDRGFYRMEGVEGYDFFCADKPLRVTELKIRGKTTMVDDPLHSRGMELLAKAAKGNVLVGGLGLGLVAHALAKNPDVASVDVVEREADVIGLVGPQIPQKVKVHQGDIFDPRWLRERRDTVILDIWVTGGQKGKEGRKGERAQIMNEMLGAFARFKFAQPQADVFIWGMREPAVNPAVKKKPCLLYYELLGAVK